MTNGFQWLLALALLVAAPGFGLAQQKANGDANGSGSAKTREIAEQLVEDLREARQALSGISDRRTREQIELLISRAELRARELQKIFANVAVPSGASVVSAAEFAKMLKALKKESFDEGKLSFIKGLGKTPRFTSRQVHDLLAAFTFDGDRVKAAVSLYPQIVDQHNFFTALEAFTFDSGRQQVREQLGLN